MNKIVPSLIPLLILNCYLMPVQPASVPTARLSLSEKQFLRYKMFFLDTLYLRHFLNNHAKVPEEQKVQRTTFQVWLHTEQTQCEVKRSDKAHQFCYLGNRNGSVFKLLVEGRDYRLSDIYEGCIRFDSATICDGDVIGICMATRDNATILKGDTSTVSADDSIVFKKSLWILKNQNPVETDSNFSLMWRTVYPLPQECDLSNIRVTVLGSLETGDTTDRIGTTLFSSVLGLTDFAGNANLGASTIFDRENRLLIIPAFVENGRLNNEPFSNPALGKDNRNPGIYHKTDEAFLELKHKFAIIIKWPLPSHGR